MIYIAVISTIEDPDDIGTSCIGHARQQSLRQCTYRCGCNDGNRTIIAACIEAADTKMSAVGYGVERDGAIIRVVLK